jgi:hypothetical protein
VLPNIGAGLFGARIDIEVPRAPADAKLADLDGDEDVDLIYPVGGQVMGVDIMLNTGEGLAPPFTVFGSGSFPSQVVPADFDLDGRIDFVLRSGSFSGIQMYHNDGGLLFTELFTIPDIENPGGVSAADANTDGRPDLLVINQGPTDVFIYTTAPPHSRDANGNGIPDECEGLCFADYNADGFVDGIDYDSFNNDFEAGALGADVNGDGFVDGIDYDRFMARFEAGC